MLEQQLDLFSANNIRVEQPFPLRWPILPEARNLEDEALIVAIPSAGVDDYAVLVAEAARRRLTAAVPAIEALCRRFAGFGIDRMVPEQSTALRALAAIGSPEATQAVSLLIMRRVVSGPALGLAVAIAAQLNATVSIDVLRSLLDTPSRPFAPMLVAALADNRS
jgi:hypothetical protein